MKFSPSITIITATLNPHIPTFIKVLESVKKQKYSGKIEHIILDGGTTNGSIKIAKEYGCKIIFFKKTVDEGSWRMYRGLKKASGELILLLESDNIIPHSLWFQKMVKPFEIKKVFSTYPAFNSYEKNMSLLTKYTALFGSPDPTLYYLKKSDKVPMYQKKYNRGEIIKENKDFYVIKFSKYNLLTMGDNGFFIKASVLKSIVYRNKPYIHVDAFLELLDRGFDTYGIVKDSIIHTTQAHILNMIKRRVEVKETFYDGRRGQRKYLVYNPNSTRDRINLIKYIIFSLTFVIPFLEALRGYMKIREKAWFLHPIMCFLMVIGYGVSEIRWYISHQVFRSSSRKS